MPMNIAVRIGDLAAGSVSEEFDLNVKNGKVKVKLADSEDGESCVLQGDLSRDGNFALFKVADSDLYAAINCLAANYLNYVVCNYVHDARGEVCKSLRAFVGDSFADSFADFDF